MPSAAVCRLRAVFDVEATVPKAKNPGVVLCNAQGQNVRQRHLAAVRVDQQAKNPIFLRLSIRWRAASGCSSKFPNFPNWWITLSWARFGSGNRGWVW